MTKEERLKAAEYYPGVSYQQLFDHMIDEHGLTLLQGEMDEIIRIVKGAEAEAESKWVSVDESLPNDREIVLICWEYEGIKRITSGCYVEHGYYWQHANATQLKVSHWQPLPSPPLNQQ